MIKRILFLAAAALVLAGCCCGKKDARNNPESYIEVTGRAEKEVDPDIFYLSISLSENNTGRVNISTMEQRMLAALKSAGVDAEKQLTVTGMYGENWYWWRRSRSVYQNKSYQLKATDLEVLNRACDKLDSMGYVNYNFDRAEYSKMDELKMEVQQQAVRQARLKATSLLAGANQQVGKLIFLQEQRAYAPGPMYQREYGYEDKSIVQEEAYSPVNFRTLKVSYDIVARFGIE